MEWSPHIASHKFMNYDFFTNLSLFNSIQSFNAQVKPDCGNGLPQWLPPMASTKMISSHCESHTEFMAQFKAPSQLRGEILKFNFGCCCCWSYLFEVVNEPNSKRQWVESKFLLDEALSLKHLSILDVSPNGMSAMLSHLSAAMGNSSRCNPHGTHTENVYWRRCWRCTFGEWKLFRFPHKVETHWIPKNAI